MAVHYRVQGFVIKKADKGEADQLFTIYTKDYGKLEILGKAIRKIKSKLRSGAELFYLSEIEFIQGKAHKTLTDAVLIDNFQNIRGDLARLKIACQIVETLDNLVIREEKDDQIWQLLDEIFHKLNNCSFFTAHCSLLYYYFFWNLISILGYQPELYLCLVCQKRIIPEKNYFDFEQGGTICKNCADNFLKQSQSRGDAKMTQEISLNVIKILRIFLNKDLLLIKKLKIERKDRELLTKISRYSFLLLSRAL